MNKLLLAILATLTATITFAAQPIEITAPHGPGGPSDNMARTLENLLPKGDYVTMNRGGAASQIGTRHAIDNHTLLITNFVQVFVTNSNMQEDLRNKIQTDLEIIAAVGVMPSVLICNKDLKIKTLNDIKNYPRTLTFGTTGLTSSSHVSTEVLFRTIKRNHDFIPYPTGQAQMSADLMGGHLDCTFLSGAAHALMGSPQISIILSSHKVSKDIPSWKELVKSDFPFNSVTGLAVSKNMDPVIKNKIKTDLAVALARPEAKSKIISAGFLFYAKVTPSEIAEELKHLADVKKYFDN
jgi:tripartite-type tricarboxylate transporter receptor subunit TctC